MQRNESRNKYASRIITACERCLQRTKSRHSCLMDNDADVLYGDIFCFFNATSDTILNVEGFCEESAYPLEYDRVNKAILDWTGAMFVIEPKSSFSSRQEFLSFVSDNVLSLFGQASATNAFPSELHEQATTRKAQMAQRVAFELEAASSNYDQHRGHPVKYGDVVQLRHVNSGRYFCAKASGTDGSTELAVVDAADAVENSHWQLFSSTRQSGNVKFSVEMQLSSVVYGALMAVAIGPTGPFKYAMSPHVDAFATFQLVHLGQDSNQSTCLCVGDSIHVSHFSSSKMLTSRYGDFQTFVDIDNQSMPAADNYMFAPACACFVVESENVFDPIKTQVQSNRSIRLRCLSTGEIVSLASHVGPEVVRIPCDTVAMNFLSLIFNRLTCLQDSESIFSVEYSKPMIVCTIQASPTIREDTTFCLPGISDHANIADSCFQILHIGSTINLAIQPKSGIPTLVPNFAEGGNNTFFRCSLANPKAVLECRRLASFKSIFEYIIALIGLEVSMSAEVVSLATHHFEGLSRWITDAPTPQARLWRQAGLHDNGCVDHLRTLLGAPMEICKMPISAIVKQQRYRHVCSFISSCGSCIESVVTNCPQNGSRFLSWIESLIELMTCFESVAKVILACFICSKGASRLLKIEHIHAIVELSKGPARSRLYHSLSQLLMKGGDDSVRCQDYLLSKFFPSPSERETLGNTREIVPSLRADGKSIVVIDITIDRLPQSLDTVVNSPALFGSLCGFLELTDALCHNYCERALKEFLAIDVIPYHVGISVLNDSYVPYLLKLRVLKVMHRLYVLTLATRALDCSSFDLLIPWSTEDNISHYSVSNIYPDRSSWDSLIALQDIVLQTIEGNDSLGFDSDKDAFTAAALSVASSLCRIGMFCMPVETVVKAAGPYFRSRAQSFLNSKVVERGKALQISSDDVGSASGIFLQLELLLQPLQLLLDTSTDNTKGGAKAEAAECKTSAMQCISVILGIRRHLQILQTLKRFSEDISASKVSKNVDLLKFTPSAITVEPIALQLIRVNMATLPGTLTNLFCHPQNTNRFEALDLIVTIFLDSVHFFETALQIVLMSDALIISSYRAMNDFKKLMALEFAGVIAVLTASSSVKSSGDASSQVSVSTTGDTSQVADFVLRFQQISEIVVRPITFCSSAEVLKKIYTVAQQLSLHKTIMAALSDILSIFAPIERHEASNFSASVRKSTPRPMSSRSSHFSEFHKRLVDSLSLIIIKLCPDNPSTQKYFFSHIDVLMKLLQLYSDNNESQTFTDAISAILEGNRDLCILAQDVLIPDLIILLLRKGKWHNVLVLLRKCITFEQSSALAGIQKVIMLGLVRNFVMLVQLPVSESVMFSQRSIDLKEVSAGYTIECMRLLSRLCVQNVQNQNTVRSWIPLAEVTSVLRQNMKNHTMVATYIDLVAAAYMVSSFDVSSDLVNFPAILKLFGDVIRVFCDSNSINVISERSFDLHDISDSSSVPSYIIPGASFSLNAASPLFDSIVMFLVAMFRTHQPVHIFTTSIQFLSRHFISIICDRSCLPTQRASVKRLLDHVCASRLLPSSIVGLYGSLPSQFEHSVASSTVVAKTDDSAASLWPYFLNQEYGIYLKDVDDCVAQLVKHFKDPLHVKASDDFEAYLIWAIQQVSLSHETRTVLIKVTHLLWKSSDTAWLSSKLRVIFSIFCDLCVDFKEFDTPSKVHFAAVSFSTELFSNSETRNIFQGEFYDVIKSYGTVCVASIQTMLDSAVFHAEEYARRCSSSSAAALASAHDSDSQESFLSFCQELLKLLKAFCEGHFSEGQAFVGQSLGSLNVINLSTQLLMALSTAQSDLAHSLQLSCLDFLVESIQGPCLQNCAVALNSRICAAFNTYIRLEPYSHEFHVVPSDIAMARFEKFFVFFQAMLEETRTDTSSKPLYRSVVNFILANIDFTQVLAFLENACSLNSSSSKFPEKMLRLRHLCSYVFVLLTYLGVRNSDCPHVLKQFSAGFRLKNTRGMSNAAVARWEAFIGEFWNGIVSIEICRDGTLCQVTTQSLCAAG
jgi:hypothetical protein